MRPHKLKISAFLSYGGEEVIDFDELSSAGGLFLIHGRTGAGKTSILDALSYAIYGQLPGSRKDVAKSYRSDFAKDETITFVELELTVGGKRLKVYRKPDEEFTPQDGGKVKKRKAATKLVEIIDGNEVPIAEGASEANVELERMMGMKADQFFKLILLPQGDFAQFLRSSSIERAKILNALFKDEVKLFKEIMVYFKQRLENVNKSLDDAQHSVDLQQQSIETAFDTLYPNRDYDLDSDIPADANSAKAYLELLTEGLSVAQARLAETEKERTEALALSIAAENAFNASAKVRDARNALESAEKSLAEWREKNIETVAAKVKNEKVSEELSALVSNLERAITKGEESNKKFENLINARNSVIELTARNTTSQGDLVTHKVVIAENAEAIRALKEKVSKASNPEAEQEKANSALKDLNTTLDKVKASRKVAGEIKTLTDELTELQAVEKLKEAEYQNLSYIFESEQASVLAAKLTKGGACPVCGSTEHPHPAKNEGSTTKDKVKKAEDAAKKAGTAVTEKMGELKAKNEKLNEFTDVKDLNQKEVEDQIAEIRNKLDALAAQAAELVSDQEKLAVLEEEQSKGQEKLITLTAAAATTAEALEGSVNNVATLEKALEIEAGAEIKLVDVDKPAQEISRLIGLKKAFEPLLENFVKAKAARETLDDVSNDEIPDHLAAKQEHMAAEARCEAAKKKVDRLLSLQMQLKSIEKSLKAAEKNLGNSTVESGKYARLSMHINGLTGERVTLEQFYLGHRLQQILVYANERLQEMTQGQFTLQPNPNKKGAGQNYLAISVFDAWNQGTRDASTLSGGETFTASLALAFGLADVVSGEAGGKTLESLFIDEGFGTLDPTYLEKVMQSLYALRESGRMVGLISHVEEMKQRIPMQLEVTKESNAGAHVRIFEAIS